MQTDFDLQNIWLTYFAEKNSTEKLIRCHQHIFPLLKKLDCRNYSNFIESLGIILVSFSPVTYPETEKLYFRKKKKEIEIRINMDYEKLLQATESETLQLIAQTYLSAISRFLSKRKDFDYQRFYEDVRNLFVEKGYLHENEH